MTAPNTVPGLLSASAFTLALLLAGSQPGHAQGADEGCAVCHQELEFLRQHAPDLETARRRRVTQEVIERSAHAGSACSECHVGFDRWPHQETSFSRDCGSCHQDADTAWHAGVHGRSDKPGIDSVACVSCHTRHDVAVLDSLRGGSARTLMNRNCVSCHVTSALPEGDPHRDRVACASCHLPHSTRDVDEVTSSVAPGRQVETCGACHDEEAELARADAHGLALAERPEVGLATLELQGASSPPTCTTCHGSHGMATVEGPAIMNQTVVCGECHEHAMETYDDSYHGQATALGSVAVATCADCHGRHGIFGEDDPRSTIHPDRLVESCGECHEASRASFVLYQPHADHNDRENYPFVYWSYRLMTVLLVGVFTVFGLHSALWVGRLTLDALRRSKGEQG